MRLVYSFFLAIAVTTGTGAGPMPATAQSVVDVEKKQKLDTLFLDLSKARTERDAKIISKKIWDTWYASGSASIDLMMIWAQQAMESKKFEVALDFLDQVVTLAPDFAEGWNRRATVHFMMDNYAKSMADIDQTLRLEPRHFGALAGMGMIMKNTGRKERALEAYERVLEYYPMMRSAQNEVIELSEDLAGDGI